METQGEFGIDLTEREVQILQLVALGNSAKEVAKEIEISPRTVECHIDTIRLKMRARNRAHMVAIALASQLIDAPPCRTGRLRLSGYIPPRARASLPDLL